jgi:2,4-dienoyl-CoA reductase-like NADH-dependent reductase (Old Yellow Enzyme family)
MNQPGTIRRLASEDRDLVDLLRAVLVDPSLHTDRRMRLHREISGVLRSAHRDLYGESADDAYEQALETHGAYLPDLLRSVLVDPNLYTDLRMRLHREIRAVLRFCKAGLG